VAVLVASLPGAATATPARLSPQALTLDLPAGSSQSLDYTLSLDAQPMPPTDVYLLVDASASMQPYLADLRAGLYDAIRPLAAMGAYVGVGEFRSTAAADWSDGLTYRALRGVGPVDARLDRVIADIGRDEPRLPPGLPGQDAHTVALHDAMTGDGYVPYTGPGQQAGFRPGARRVVAVITDGAFADDPTQPSRDDAVASLRAAGAQVFGLALGTAALGDLTAVASATGAVTAVTVDCGGGRRLAPAAWTTVLDVPSQKRVRLDVGCAAGDAGVTHTIRLTASVAGTRVAVASLTLHCRAGG